MLAQTFSFLIKGEYHNINNEPNIYVRKVKSNFVIMGVYVDLSLISNSKSYLIIAKKELARVFPITNLGSMPYFLGIQVKIDKIILVSLSQSRYITSIL